MLSREQHVEISVLIRQGLSIRAIARQMRCSRIPFAATSNYSPSSSPSSMAARATRGQACAFRGLHAQRVEAARPHWIRRTLGDTDCLIRTVICERDPRDIR